MKTYQSPHNLSEKTIPDLLICDHKLNNRESIKYSYHHQIPANKQTVSIAESYCWLVFIYLRIRKVSGAQTYILQQKTVL